MFKINDIADLSVLTNTVQNCLRPSLVPLILTVCSTAEKTAVHAQTHVHCISMDHKEQRELMS